MKSIKTTLKIAGSTIALSALVNTAFAADFGALDANSDGQVTFAEYKAVALTEGKTVTLLAQEFTRMTQGDAVLTEDEFWLSIASRDEPYTSEQMPYEPIETVTEVETFEDNPDSVEPIDPPVIQDVVPNAGAEEINPVIVETPLEIAPAVAGETERSNEIASEDWLSQDMIEETPVEEGEMDSPAEETPETEIDELGVETSEIY
ncbi:hypothetical protein GCM10011309_18570 [Litorimonas cladophorae]|uniref:EF-hand domain-containing protein n=1 Tax=Litorimonas cladophorae TaxID=1220491 RepID=A0A918KQ43_9PROT|nr:hypothetical protein [Litorimonas cladophorae]GGX68971.1 hypothetical protein GCM10011309_18570 [Litorimonas cladophorae]